MDDLHQENRMKADFSKVLCRQMEYPTEIMERKYKIFVKMEVKKKQADVEMSAAPAQGTLSKSQAAAWLDDGFPEIGDEEPASSSCE